MFALGTFLNSHAVSVGLGLARVVDIPGCYSNWFILYCKYKEHRLHAPGALLLSFLTPFFPSTASVMLVLGI